MSLRKSLFVFVLCLVGLTLAGCNNPDEKAAKYIQRGNVQFEQGDYAKARVEYKNAARIKPTDAEVRYRLGLVDEAEGDFQNAFANFTFAEQQNARFYPALLKLAQYYMIGEQYDQSRKRLDAVLASTPDDPEAHALLAGLLLRQEDFTNAEKEARFALNKDPANKTATSALTGLYSSQGNEEKAGQTVDTGIARNPQDLSLLLLKAMLYEHSRNLAKIAEAYNAIFKLKPSEAKFRADLAAIYHNAKKDDEAESVLREGAAAMPADWDMKHQLVQFLGDHRGVDAAEKEIRVYMQANPENDDLYFWLADLYIAHNDSDRAIALLEQIVTRNPAENTGLNARTTLARIHFTRGNKALAEKLVAAVLEKAPGNHEALFIRANLFFDQGLYQSAVSDLRTILRGNPRAIDVFPVLSEAFLLQGNLDLAIDTLSQLMDVDPDNTAVRVRLAQMYSLNGDAKRALEMLALVTKTNPQYAVGWESTARIAIEARDWPAAESAIRTLDSLKDQRLTATFLEGQVLEHTGKTDEALRHYTQVIDADPSSPLAEHALTALVDAYQSLGRLDSAVQYIAALKTDSPYATTLLGQCQVKLGHPEAAAAAFDKSIAANASFQDPYLARAQLYLNDHNPASALDILKKAAAAAPADMRAPLATAGILVEMGRHREAAALYEEILARNPGVNVAANNLSEIIADYQYADPQALEKARRIAERFVSASDPLLLDTLGWVYYRQGNLQQAQTVMERMMAAGLASGVKLPPQMHYHYGALLLKTGNTGQAKKELQQAVNNEGQGPAYPGLDEAKKMLEGL